MLDWITLLIEGVGFVILCIWVVLPIQEFKSIFGRLREEEKTESGKFSSETRPGGHA